MQRDSNDKLDSLLDAILENNLEAVQTIAKTEDVNACIMGISYLHHAIISKSRSEIIEALIKNGADVNAKSEKNGLGLTPLHYAVNMRNGEIIRLLHENGADINGRTAHNNTALHLACTPATFTKDSSSFATVTPIDPEIIELLIKLGADLHAVDASSNCTALHAATKYNCLKAVEILLANGVNIEAESKSKSTPLHWLAKETDGDRKIAQMLLSKGNKAKMLNAKDEDGYTPLHCAVQCNNYELVEEFISAGANVNAKSKNLHTILHVINKLSNTSDVTFKIAQLLIDKGAKISEGNDLDMLPIHLVASSPNNGAIIKLLHSNGANVNAKRKNIFSPLYYTVVGGANLKANILASHFKVTVDEMIKMAKENTFEIPDVFKQKFNEIDDGFIETAKALLECGADILKEIMVPLSSGQKASILLTATENSKITNYPLNKFLHELYKKQSSKQTKNNNANKDKEIPKEKTQAELEKEEKIAKQKEEQRLAKENKRKLVEEEKTKEAAKPIDVKIKEKFTNNLICVDLVAEQNNKTFKITFKAPNDSYQRLKSLFSTHFKNAKFTYPPKEKDLSCLAFTVNENILNDLFINNKNANFTSSLNKIIDDNRRKEATKSPEANKTKSPEEIASENTWDKEFAENWKKHIEKTFPFSVTINTQIDDNKLTIEVTLSNTISSEQAQQIANLLDKHFSSGYEAKVTYDNKINIKPLNKPAVNNYKEVPQPTFQNTSAIKEKLSTLIPSNTTTQIIKSTQKNVNKPVNVNSNSNSNNINEKDSTNVNAALAFTEEDKKLFLYQLKTFLNDICGNILTDKLDYFIRKDVRQNRLELAFDIEAFSSLSTLKGPISSTRLFSLIKEAINQTMNEQVFYFDENKNSLKFIFSKISKEDFFAKAKQIQAKFNELNVPEGKTETDTVIGKKEITTDDEVTSDISTPEAPFTLEKLMQEIQQSLFAIKINENKQKGLNQLIATHKQFSNNFEAYKLLTTVLFTVLSKEVRQDPNCNNSASQLFNIRSILRHAYNTYDQEEFLMTFSPFFDELEKLCLQIFTSTSVKPTLFNKEAAPIKNLYHELTLFGDFLQCGMVKANPSRKIQKNAKEKIEKLIQTLNTNQNDTAIYLTILQKAALLGENNPNSIEGQLYGKLHLLKLTENPINTLIELCKDYIAKLHPEPRVNHSF